MKEKKKFSSNSFTCGSCEDQACSNHQAKTSERRRRSPGKHSQRTCLKKKKKKKRLKLQQNSDKTNSSGFLTQIRRKSLIEPELTGVAVEGVAERVEKPNPRLNGSVGLRLHEGGQNCEEILSHSKLDHCESIIKYISLWPEQQHFNPGLIISFCILHEVMAF